MTHAGQLLLPINDACAALGVGRTSLYQLIADGRIPVVHLGRRTLVPADELARYAAALPRIGAKQAEAAETADGDA